MLLQEEIEEHYLLSQTWKHSSRICWELTKIYFTFLLTSPRFFGSIFNLLVCGFLRQLVDLLDFVQDILSPHVQYNTNEAFYQLLFLQRSRGLSLQRHSKEGVLSAKKTSDRQVRLRDCLSGAVKRGVNTFAIFYASYNLHLDNSYDTDGVGFTFCGKKQTKNQSKKGFIYHTGSLSGTDSLFVKPHKDEKGFLDNFYLLVCMAKHGQFFLAKELVPKLVVSAFGKENLFVCRPPRKT